MNMEKLITIIKINNNLHYICFKFLRKIVIFIRDIGVPPFLIFYHLTS